MARQFFIIFGCLAFGEFVVWLTGIKLPSSIIGMLALTALLKLNVVELSWVQKLSEFLISNLGFFFVPPGVAIMLYLDLIEKQLIPILMATVISTICVLIATGQSHQLVIKIERIIIKNKLLHIRRLRRHKTKETK